MMFQCPCKFYKKFVYIEKILRSENVKYRLHYIIRRHFYVSSAHRSEKNSNNSPLKKVLEDSASFQDTNVEHPSQQWVTLPYTHKVNLRKQGDFYKRPKHDPRETSVILFPGQGAQYVGMANNLLKFPVVRELFELSNYILGYDLLKLCTEGPKDVLNQTKYCQPAVMVCSLAAVEKLKEQQPNVIVNCVATAGFSLGEITALVFAGALGFETALQLVHIRAEAMQIASEMYKGGMILVMYGPDSKLNYACLKAKQWALDKGDEFPECKIANYLYPHCKVVAGSQSAIDFLERNFKEFNIKKIKRLSVNGAFHCDLMVPAIEPFRKALNKSQVDDPAVTVYSCFDGKGYKNAEHIKKQLPKQMIKPVKWEQLLHVVYERDPEEYFPKTFECGPGKFLKTVLKQVNAKAWNQCYSSDE